MASGAALRAKVEKSLRKAEATHRVVKFRRVTRTGGNPILGIGGTIGTELVEVNPQPAVEQLDAEHIATSGGRYQFGDYKFTFGGSVSESILRTHQILYGDEVLQIVQHEPAGVMQKTVIAWTVIARTLKQG